MAVYKIVNVATNKCLNITGNNPFGENLYDGQNITLWTDSTSSDQKWVISALSTRVQIIAYANEDMGLNAYTAGSTFKCTLHELKGNANDSQVDFQLVSGNQYRIKLSNHSDKYLTADGTSVVWAKNQNNNYQLWKLMKLVIVPDSPDSTVYAQVGTLMDSSADFGLKINEDKLHTNARYIYKYLTKQGFSKAAICAVLGNFQVESSLNPGIWQFVNYGGGYGLGQWTPPEKFFDWAVSVDGIPHANTSVVNALSRTDPQKLMDAELAFFIWDFTLRNDVFQNSSAWTLAKFKAGTGAQLEQLTREFFKCYEQADNTSGDLRVEYAEKWYKFSF